MKLGKKQKEFLSKVCKTNGGGVYITSEWEKIALRLNELGLIQGKLGQPSCAVHTREGLEINGSHQRSATK